jgi:hypothetical protein
MSVYLSVDLFILTSSDLLLRLAMEHSLESGAPARTSICGNRHMERSAHLIIIGACSLLTMSVFRLQVSNKGR